MTFEDFYGESYLTMRYAEKQLLNIIDSYTSITEEQEDIKPIIYTCSRIKNPENMIAKLKRKNLEQSADAALYQVYDAIGIRVVCAFAEDVYTLVAWLRTVGDIEILEEKDYYANPKPNGYRSYHLLIRIAKGTGRGFRAEIQVRTIANDFWAALEHRLKYKKNIPHEQIIQNELKRCAFEIASVDASMQAIRDILKEK